MVERGLKRRRFVSLGHRPTHGNPECFEVEGLVQHINETDGLAKLAHILLKITAALQLMAPTDSALTIG